MSCGQCLPWNFPLHFKREADGSMRTMNYHESIFYRWHVVHHQSPDSWQGDIDEYTQELRAADRMRAHRQTSTLDANSFTAYLS